jgi:hypothetical protein
MPARASVQAPLPRQPKPGKAMASKGPFKILFAEIDYILTVRRTGQGARAIADGGTRECREEGGQRRTGDTRFTRQATRGQVYTQGPTVCTAEAPAAGSL